MEALRGQAQNRANGFQRTVQFRIGGWQRIFLVT
jgi:hypothetical protein